MKFASSSWIVFRRALSIYGLSFVIRLRRHLPKKSSKWSKLIYLTALPHHFTRSFSCLVISAPRLLSKIHLSRRLYRHPRLRNVSLRQQSGTVQFRLPNGSFPRRGFQPSTVENHRYHRTVNQASRLPVDTHLCGAAAISRMGVQCCFRVLYILGNPLLYVCALSRQSTRRCQPNRLGIPEVWYIPAGSVYALRLTVGIYC